MSERPPPATILETALYAPDLDAAEAFYGGILGLERVARAGDRHVFFRLDRAMLLIFNPAETASRRTTPPCRSRRTAPAAPATSPSPPAPRKSTAGANA